QRWNVDALRDLETKLRRARTTSRAPGRLPRLASGTAGTQALLADLGRDRQRTERASRRALREYAPTHGVLGTEQRHPRKGDSNAQANAAHRPLPCRARGGRRGDRYRGNQREEERFEEGQLTGAGRGLLTPDR